MPEPIPRGDTYVFAYVFERGDGSVLLVKRRDDALEYPGQWSIPTVRVSQDKWGAAKDAPDVAREAFTLRLGPLEGTPLPVTAEHRDRVGYKLHMALYRVACSDAPDGLSRKYAAHKFVTPTELVSHFPNGGGTCVALLVNRLIAQGVLGTATPFVEMPPDLIGIDVEQISGASLWKRSAIAYQGRDDEAEAGVKNGATVKRLTVDQFFRDRIAELAPSVGAVVDLGCGSGALVRWMREQGIDAHGVDLLPGPHNEPEARLHAGDITRTLGMPVGKAGLILLNLVLQWVDDLDALMDTIDETASPKARILTSIVPSEFSKNGDWLRQDGSWSWVITQPMRRKPMLTMINHSVGPLKLYLRSLPEYFELFGKRGYTCAQARYLYVDSCIAQDDLDRLLKTDPDLIRHVMLPCFVVFEHIKAN